MRSASCHVTRSRRPGRKNADLPTDDPGLRWTFARILRHAPGKAAVDKLVNVGGRQMTGKPAELLPIVFVVDDDGAVREALSDLLVSVGLRVETFGSTAEFLHSKLRDAPGCLVLDVRLPGLSGLDFQTELANAGIRIPV